MDERWPAAGRIGMIIAMRENSAEVSFDGIIACEVTRYSVVNDTLLAVKRTEETSWWVDETRGYLYLGNSAASAPLDGLRDSAERGQDWPAQAGTPPVKVTCDDPGRYMECCGPGGCQAGWGGRNYPKIVVPAGELARVLGVSV